MRVMLPLMDLINHGNEEEANLKLFRDDQGDYIAFATRDIKKGEQVRYPATVKACRDYLTSANAELLMHCSNCATEPCHDLWSAMLLKSRRPPGAWVLAAG